MLSWIDGLEGDLNPTRTEKKKGRRQGGKRERESERARGERGKYREIERSSALGWVSGHFMGFQDAGFEVAWCFKRVRAKFRPISLLNSETLSLYTPSSMLSWPGETTLLHVSAGASTQRRGRRITKTFGQHHLTTSVYRVYRVWGSGLSESLNPKLAWPEIPLTTESSQTQ